MRTIYALYSDVIILAFLLFLSLDRFFLSDNDRPP